MEFELHRQIESPRVDFKVHWRVPRDNLAHCEVQWRSDIQRGNLDLVYWLAALN